jgi:hypothetical protein
MKHLIFSLISISMLASTFAACSSSSSNGTPSGDGGTTTTTNDSCGAYIAAENAYSIKCNGGVDTTHVSADNARFSTYCNALEKLNGISPNFDSAIAACATALTAADCNTTIDQIAACNTGIPNGTLNPGDACSTGLQCASGGCSAGTELADGGSSTCGTCEAPVGDGADCSSAPCVAGDTCSLSIDGSGNLSSTCTAVTTPGATGATCSSDDDCLGPNHCNFASADAQTGTCGAPSAAGVACSANQDCAPGLVCTGTDTTTCVTAVAAGGTCASSTDCAIGTACDTTTLKCTTVVFGAPGAACDEAEHLCTQGQCNIPQSSDPDAGTATTGTCPTVIADGQACDDSDASQTCDDYASCVGGVCTLLPAICN